MTGAPLAVLRGHEGTVTCVAFAPDRSRVVSGATDRTVRIWNAADGLELACLRLADPGIWSRMWHSDGRTEEIHAVGAVAFTADGGRILTLSDGDRLRIWDPATRECVRSVHGVVDVRAVAAGSPWAAFLRDGMVEVEEGATGTIVARAPAPRNLGGHARPVTRPDGRAWAYAPNHLYFWSLQGGSGPDISSAMILPNNEPETLLGDKGE